MTRNDPASPEALSERIRSRIGDELARAREETPEALAELLGADSLAWNIRRGAVSEDAAELAASLIVLALRLVGEGGF